MEQESQKRKLEETSCDTQQSAPILCANNCGFFGSPNTNNLCSKCYKEFLLKQPKTELPPAPVPAEQKKKLVVAVADDTAVSAAADEVNRGSTTAAVVSEDAKEGVAAAAASSEEKQPAVAVAVANRCSFCRKRVGLTGFKCRCGLTFCSQHRYSDKHNCAFDYKSAGQDAIAKANPVVKADKIDKI